MRRLGNKRGGIEGETGILFLYLLLGKRSISSERRASASHRAERRFTKYSLNVGFLEAGLQLVIQLRNVKK